MTLRVGGFALLAKKEPIFNAKIFEVFFAPFLQQ